MNSIIEIYGNIFKKLEKDEKPFFFNYWLKELNLSRCYLLKKDKKTVAFASYPKKKDIHYERWQSKNLAVLPEFKETIILPEEFKETEYFITPVLNSSCNPTFTISDSTITVNQINYEKHLTTSRRSLEPHDIKFMELQDHMVEEVQGIVIPEYIGESLPEFYIPSLKREIRNSVTYNSAWCFCAKSQVTGKIIAFSLYLAFDLPLSGVPCALVGDIIVIPEMRNKGIGTKLQKYSYRKLRKKGINRVCGNIDTSNTPSLRHVKKLKRKPWSMAIKVEKK
jgi:GNAT superfamily N-acetyltransferase